MKAIQYFFLFAIFSIPVRVRAQYFQFTQYNFSVQRVNPAWVGLSRDAIVDFEYRNQKTGGDFQLNSNFLSVAYPFFQRSTGKPWSGLGISLLSDKSGPLFKSQEAAATFAVNISTGVNQNLSLGFKGLMRWQRINLDGLFTGSQFLEGHGFDPALDNGEEPKPFQNNYFTISAGLLWQQTDRDGKLIKQLGFSFFDFNKPNPSFLDGSQDELPSTWVAHGSWRVFQKNKLEIVPEFLLTRSSTKNFLMAGGKFQYSLDKTNRVDLLLKYAVGRSGIIGLQLNREKFSVGMSYDFPMGSKNVGNLGAMEIGLEYRNPVDPKNKRDSAKKKKAKKRKAELAKGKSKQPVKKDVLAKTPIKKESLTKSPERIANIREIVSESRDSTSKPIPAVIIEKDEPKNSSIKTKATAGPLTHEPHLVEKIILHFRFNYNSTDMDEETEKFLEELSQTLLSNPSLTLKITGHTDNIGSPHMNHRLSWKRAEVVKAHLLKLGVSPAIISTDGKGMDEPVNANTTDEERAMNRRVEIKLMTNEQ